MDYDTGQRVLFGRDGAPQAPLPDAVVASCSIPGWYQPAMIGGRRYADGGVRCPTSLGALSGTYVDEVYVLAPMASTEPGHPLALHLRLERRLRQLQLQAPAGDQSGGTARVLFNPPVSLNVMLK